MRICNCILSGTKACENCYNNGSFTYGGNYNYSKTTTFSFPIEEEKLSKEDYKEILKYLIDKIDK